MIEVIKYSSENKQEWDSFVSQSNNGSFLFYRDYMEYHSDRFEDFSLLIYRKNKLVALFPANVVDEMVHSHQGLTYGSLLLKQRNHYTDIAEYLNAINQSLADKGIKQVIIKSTPYFYAKNLAQELDLTLQRNKNIETETILGVGIVCQGFDFPSMSLSKKKLELYKMEESNDYNTFWKLLSSNLWERYKSSPVHSLQEINQLKNSFPNNIKLYLFRNQESGEIDAGTVLFINKNTIKTQYISSTPEGRRNRVSDALYYSIINKFKADYQYIDFGTCEESDNSINLSLLNAKEKFGANSFPIYKYQYSTSKVFTL